MIISEVRPFLLHGDETYGSGATGAEATDQGDWLLLVRVRTEDGLEAWADVETLGTVAARVISGDGMGALGFRTIDELLVGRVIEDLEDIEALWHELFIGTVYYGRRGVAMQALSAIDNCLWSLWSQQSGRSVIDLLGGRRRDRLPAYASTLFRSTPEGNASAARGYAERGFTGIKFGWGGFGRDQVHDRESLAAIKEALPPGSALMVDPGWYLDDNGRPRVRTDKETATMLNLLAEFDLVWVEDIVHPEQTDEYARWAAEFPTIRFAAGEQQATVWEFERLLSTGALRYLQPDLSRCGGLTVARHLVQPSAVRGVQIVTHSWLTDLLHGYSLQLLATLPTAPWVEFNVAQSVLTRGVAATHLRLEPDGTVEVPEQVTTVDLAFVEAHAVS
jgi:L-rhamnonate dehydratase